MKIKFRGQIISAHGVSTKDLVNEYQLPTRRKDKTKIEAALRSRGINIHKRLFLDRLNGEQAPSKEEENED